MQLAVALCDRVAVRGMELVRRHVPALEHRARLLGGEPQRVDHWSSTPQGATRAPLEASHARCDTRVPIP